MSEIADAIHADAEAARAEIRTAGIVCPSCGVNMADLPRDHTLTLGRAYETALLEPARCNYGTPAKLGDWETFKAAANVSFWDGVNAAMDEEFSKMLGWDINGPTPEAGFTGLLDVLNGDA